MMKLKAIGIPAEWLPVDEENEVLVQDHLVWIAEREEKEAIQSEPAQKRSRTQRDNKAGAISGLMAHTSSLCETLNKTEAPTKAGSSYPPSLTTMG